METIQEKLSYLAGIIDGEGYIGMLVARKDKSSKVFNYKIRLCVSGCSTKLMDWLVENYGGRVFSKTVYSSKHKQSYIWQLNCAQAGKVIEAVRPYLIIKRKQADLATAYRRIQESLTRTYVGQKKMDPELRHEIYECFKSLNKRGPVTTNTPDVPKLVTKIESELQRNLERLACERLPAGKHYFQS